MSIPGGEASGRRQRWFRLAAVVLGLGGLVVVDLSLRLFGVVPPDNAASLHRESLVRSFLPFVEDGDGFVTIRPGWVNDGETTRFEAGEGQGRVVLLPGFRPARIRSPKEPSTYRIVALGGSTTFGLGVGSANAFPAVLGRLLGDSLEREGLSIEVVNLGCPGWASDRVAGLFDSVDLLEPDLVLVYTGHNEMLAPESLDGGSGFDRDFHRSGRSDRGSSEADRGSGWLDRSTIFGWLRYWIRDTRAERARAETGSETEVFDDTARVHLFDPLQAAPGGSRPLEESSLESIAESYGANLRAMADRAAGEEFQTVFVLPVPNLMFPPAVSAHAEGVDETAHDALVARAQELFGRGEAKPALELVDEAIRLSPTFAMDHYWRGVILLTMNRGHEAGGSLWAALDRDVRSHRLNSYLQGAFLDVMQERELEWVDPRPLFLDPPELRRSEDLFLDWVHPTKFGHGRIAQEILASLKRDN